MTVLRRCCAVTEQNDAGRIEQRLKLSALRLRRRGVCFSFGLDRVQIGLQYWIICQSIHLLSFSQCHALLVA
jgi:hypothetical protein